MDLDVLIVGGGVTGLALAHGLTNAGIKCAVFEAEHSVRARLRDWNMGMHWGSNALRSLIGDDLFAKLQTCSVDPHEPVADLSQLRFLDSSTGEELNAIPVQKWHRLKRSTLRAFLSENGNIDVRFDKRLQSLDFGSKSDSPVTATFTDGTKLTAGMVVGADGPRSRVRDILIGDAAKSKQLPFGATFVHSKFTSEQAKFLRSFHPMYLAGVHPFGQFSFFGIQDVADPNDPSSWTFFYYISNRLELSEQEKREKEGWTSKQWLAEMKEWAKSYCDPWKSAFEWTSDDTEVWHFGFREWDPQAEGHKWDHKSGRATLAGDAAHIMTVQRGQGLNHSVTDALRLCEAIVKTKTEGTAAKDKAIGAYEEEMVQRNGEEVRLCTMNTYMLHDWEKVMQSPVFQKGMKKGGQ